MSGDSAGDALETASALSARLAGDAAGAKRRLVALLFGDRQGFALFLGALAFFGLYWRIGFLISDNWTIANTLAAVADGHLHVTELTYGRPTNQPGMHLVDGRLYGRNYGHVFLSLPLLWALEAGALVADVPILIAGGWSLLVLAFAVQVGRILDAERSFALLGSAGALAAFAANVALARPLDPRWFPVMALQASTMLAGAFVGVLLYRLIARVQGRRVGAFVGAATVLATPVGLWASVPKRHVLTAVLALLALYGFAVSREGSRGALAGRATAYVAVGTTAWVHAAEALVLLSVLLPLDLLTARRNDWRRLAALAAVFLLALTPFLATNALIADNPMEPPRNLPGYGGNPEAVPGVTTPHPTRTTPATEAPPTTPTTETPPTTPATRTAAGGAPDPGGSSGAVGLARRVGDAVATAGRLSGVAVATVPGQLTRFEAYVTRSASALVDRPDALYRTVLRSAHLAAARREGEPAINLTILESAPLLGALVAVPVLVERRLRGRRGPWLRGTAAPVDLFAVAYVLTLTLLYLTRLPLHAQLTVRYLLPAVPVSAYAVGRLASVQRVAADGARAFLWAYAALVLLGGQLAIVGLLALDPSIGELMQVHALVGLAVAGVTGAGVALAEFRGGIDPRVGGVLLALPVGFGTFFVVMTSIEYLRYGSYALGVVRLIAEALPIV